MLMTADPARLTAFTVIDRVTNEDAYLHILLRSTLQRSKLDERGRAFVTELCAGTVRLVRRMDYALASVVDRPLQEIDPPLLALLRMTAYQILEMRVPAYAAVSSAVELAKQRLGKGSASFANAVLRTLARAAQEIDWPRPEETERYISDYLSYPPWMARYLLDTFGEERALSLAKAGNLRPPLTVRVNTLKWETDGYLEVIRQRGWSGEKGRFCPEALTNLHLPGWALQEEWRSGNLAVQDESSMLVSYILDPQPGERIVDACAAPGGKATHIAQLCRDQSEIIAVDNQPRRLESLRELAGYLGISSISCMEGDSRYLPEMLDGPADRILIDAPCSGLGTLRRRPDIKLKRKREDIQEMASVQDQLLDAAAEALKPGGLLVYSVCTFTPEETVDRVTRFLTEHEDFILEDPSPFCPLGPPLPQRENERHLQILTDLHGLDGMFISRLRRRGTSGSDD